MENIGLTGFMSIVLSSMVFLIIYALTDFTNWHIAFGVCVFSSGIFFIYLNYEKLTQQKNTKVVGK